MIASWQREQNPAYRFCSFFTSVLKVLTINAGVDFDVNMIDEGHWYELKLKHPANQYLLLYQAGAQWKVVDLNKKNIDQY